MRQLQKTKHPTVCHWRNSSHDNVAEKEELEANDKVGTLMFRHVFFRFIIDR